MELKQNKRNLESRNPLVLMRSDCLGTKINTAVNLSWPTYAFLFSIIDIVQLNKLCNSKINCAVCLIGMLLIAFK